MPGPTKVRRERAVTRVVLESLSLAAEERLFAEAELMSEGALRGDALGASFFGSTMITFAVDDARRILLGLEGEEGASRLFALVEASVRVRLRAMRIACAEAARRVPEHELDTARVEIGIRRDGDKIHVDVDLEARAELRRVGSEG